MTPAQAAARHQVGVAKLNRLPSIAFGLHGDTIETACERIEAIAAEARGIGYAVDRFEMDAAFASPAWPEADVDGGVLVDGVLLLKYPGLIQCAIVRFKEGSPPCA